MAFDAFSEKNIIIWGTGKEAHRFVDAIHKYNVLWQEIWQRPCLNLCGVWDMDKKKCGKRLWGKIIKFPRIEEIKRGHTFCVLSFRDHADAKNQLLENGYEEKVDFDYWLFFVQDMKRELIECINSVLYRLWDINTLQSDISCSPKDIDYLSLGRIVKEISKSRLTEISKDLLCYTVAGYAVKQWACSENKLRMLAELRRAFSDADLVSGMEAFFGHDLNPLATFLYKNKLFTSKKKYVKTIGIYDERYANGGGQRCVSLLLPIYIKMGYNVILITDEWKAEGEYDFPQQAIRIVLKNSYQGSLRARLREVEKYINLYHIDVMCYHNHLFHESLFYEMLFIKMLNIPVIAELHLMYTFLFDSRIYMAEKLPYVYRLLDRLVVLSRFNEVFWKNLGCRAIYIPNPVERDFSAWKTPIQMQKRNGRVILWIGRVEDIEKGTMGLPEIMQYVHARCPDAVLRIVGNQMNSVADKIRAIIREKGLESCIQFCGYHAEVRSFYEEADVMLMTSHQEGFPLVLVESKLYGVPAVMYELPYLELVQDGKGFVAVPQEDRKAAAEALVRLLQNHSLRQKMSIDAKESLTKFVEYDIAGAWRKVFDELSVPRSAHVNELQKLVQEILMREIWNRSELKL